jgi:hypothetical protein
VQVGRDPALVEDAPCSLRDQAPRETLAAGLRLGADRDLVPELVVALDADAGQVLPVVVEHDQSLPTERAQPTGQPGRGGVNPYSGVRQVGRCLGPAERDPFDGVTGLAEDAGQQPETAGTAGNLMVGAQRGGRRRHGDDGAAGRVGDAGQQLRAAVPAGLGVAGAGDQPKLVGGGEPPGPANQMLA